MNSTITDILNNGATKSFKTEQIFRSFVVDRLLEALGWDIYEDVDPEATIPAGSTTIKVDYIVGSNGSKFALEAKRPGTDIVNNTRLHQQLSSYLRLSRDVDYGLLFNGTSMLIMGKESDRPSLIWKEGDRPKNVLFFSKDTFPKNLEELLKQPESSNLSTYISQNLESIIERITEEIAHETKISISDIRKKVRIDVTVDGEELSSFDAYNPSSIVKRKKQVKIKKLIIDGKNYEEKNANQVLIKTAEWLINAGAITKNTKVLSGSERYILSNRPLHPSGKPFFNEVQLSNGMYLEVDNPYLVHEKYARKLLEELGYKSDILRVEWDD